MTRRSFFGVPSAIGALLAKGKATSTSPFEAPKSNIPEGTGWKPATGLLDPHGIGMEVNHGLLYDSVTFAPGSEVPSRLVFFGSACHGSKTFAQNNMFDAHMLGAPQRFEVKAIRFWASNGSVKKGRYLQFQIGHKIKWASPLIAFPHNGEPLTLSELLENDPADPVIESQQYFSVEICGNSMAVKRKQVEMYVMLEGRHWWAVQ